MKKSCQAGRRGQAGGPVLQLIFGKSLVSGTVTANVLEGNRARAMVSFGLPRPGPLHMQEFRWDRGPWAFSKIFGGPTTSHKCQG